MLVNNRPELICQTGYHKYNPLVFLEIEWVWGPVGTEILSTSPTKNPYIFKIHKYIILSQYKLTCKNMVSGLTTGIRLPV